MGMGDDYSEYLRQESIKQAERDRVARAYAEESARSAENARQSARQEEMGRAAKSDARGGYSNHVFGDDPYYREKRGEADGGWDSHRNRTAREEAEKAKQRAAASRTSSGGAGTSRPSATVSRPQPRPVTPRSPPTRVERIVGRVFMLLLFGSALGAVGWIALQVHQDSQRSKIEESLRQRVDRRGKGTPHPGGLGPVEVDRELMTAAAR